MLIKLFGHKDCHKTKIYHSYLQEKGSQFVFLDVHEDDRRLLLICEWEWLQFLKS